jgi:biopolymer transport protein ExbD
MARRRLKFRRPELRKARIEIIPMIDTIFFLLVFFLITSLTQTKMNGLAASLPKDSPASQTKPTPKAVVTVNRAGGWYINTTRVAPAEMQSELQRMIDAAPTTIIIVNIDKTRKVQEAITVMDTVNGVRLPASAQTPDSNAPAVMIATTPVDANGNAAPAATAAPR